MRRPGALQTYVDVARLARILLRQRSRSRRGALPNEERSRPTQPGSFCSPVRSRTQKKSMPGEKATPGRVTGGVRARHSAPDYAKLQRSSYYCQLGAGAGRVADPDPASRLHVRLQSANEPVQRSLRRTLQPWWPNFFLCEHHGHCSKRPSLASHARHRGPVAFSPALQEHPGACRSA